MSKDFLYDLESGSLRAAAKINNNWVVDTQVKQKILDLMRTSPVVSMPGGFCDKEALAPRVFSNNDHVRFVPGGSSVRPGSFVGPNVVIMPPSFVNIGAYIGAGSMIDSHVLVGSCAQIGEGVHLSTDVQIGGVLEPVGNRPVIIEDNCFIGAGAILTEGILVQKGAVIAPGVFLSASVPIYDTVNKIILKGEIPPNAVVVLGTRPLQDNIWAHERGLTIACALIIKYRDEKTNAALILESALR